MKLISHNDEEYVLEHPSGKKIKVAKKGLSPEAHGIIQQFAEGGEVESPDAEETPKASEAPMVEVPAIKQMAEAPEEPEEGGEEAPTTPQLPDNMKPAMPGAAANATAAAAQPSNPFEEKAQSMQQLLGTEAQQAQQFEKALAVPAQQFGAAAASVNTQLQNLQKQSLDLQLQRKQQDDKFAAMLTQHAIDPNRYYHDQSTGSRILSGLALFLGGFGSGLTHTPNIAAEMMNNAINRDIEAQKNDQSNVMNLWKMNREAFGDDMQANLATRNQLLTGLQVQAQRAGMATGAANAQFRAQQFANQIEQEKIANRQQMSLFATPPPQGGQSQQPGQFNFDPAHLLNNIQDPAQKKAATEEVGRAQNVTRNGAKIMQLFDNAAKENTILKTGAGMFRTPASVLGLHQLLLPNFKTIDGTVRQAAMDETFHNVTPQPGDLEDKIKQKREFLQNWIESEKAAPNFKAGTGVDLGRFTSTSGVQARPQIKVVNGVKYMRGPNGEAIKVQ